MRAAVVIILICFAAWAAVAAVAPVPLLVAHTKPAAIRWLVIPVRVNSVDGEIFLSAAHVTDEKLKARSGSVAVSPSVTNGNPALTIEAIVDDIRIIAAADHRLPNAALGHCVGWVCLGVGLHYQTSTGAGFASAQMRSVHRFLLSTIALAPPDDDVTASREFDAFFFDRRKPSKSLPAQVQKIWHVSAPKKESA